MYFEVYLVAELLAAMYEVMDDCILIQYIITRVFLEGGEGLILNILSFLVQYYVGPLIVCSG